MKLKKLVSIALCMLLLITTVTGCNSSGSKEISESLILHETPQTYVLISEDSFSCMPTVTLYENGNAHLSMPPISSYAFWGTGNYVVNGDELTITHNKNVATFSISDGGNTLTLKSASFGFTKVGAVYQYRSNNDYLSDCEKIDGEKLTLDLLRELSKKAQDLIFEDFEKYAHVDISPDEHIFDIEGEYTLRIRCDLDEKTTYIVERNSSGESFPLDQNGSTGLVLDEFLGLLTVPKYEARNWIDLSLDKELPLGQSIDLSLPEFQGVTFTYTYGKVTANGNDLILGMPVWNVYLADLTNDGKPEFCSTVSFGSGIIDSRVIVYDYAAGKEYQLADRAVYDYNLSMKDGKIMVTQTDYSNSKPLVTGELRLVNGEIYRFGISRP